MRQGVVSHFVPDIQGMEAMDCTTTASSLAGELLSLAGEVRESICVYLYFLWARRGGQ